MPRWQDAAPAGVRTPRGGRSSQPPLGQIREQAGSQTPTQTPRGPLALWVGQDLCLQGTFFISFGRFGTHVLPGQKFPEQLTQCCPQMRSPVQPLALQQGWKPRPAVPLPSSPWTSPGQSPPLHLGDLSLRQESTPAEPSGSCTGLRFGFSVFAFGNFSLPILQ